METVCLYFIYFIIYAFIGWCLEVFCKLIELKRFVNRGFLVGPLCPIYGYGVLGILFLLSFGKNDDILSIFLKSIFVCSILEYSTSYVMEKLFNCRWWDYSRRRFNINGRICLDTMIPFGLLGVSLKYFVHPFISKRVLSIPKSIMIKIAIILFVVYLVDNFFSFVIMKKIKNEINDTNKDNTEAIKEYMVTWLDNNSIFYRRFKNAYPNFMIKIKSLENMAKDLGVQYKNMFVNNADLLKKNYYENKKILKKLYKKNKRDIKNK